MKEQDDFKKYTKQIYSSLKTKQFNDKDLIKNIRKLPLIYDTNESF